MGRGLPAGTTPGSLKAAFRPRGLGWPQKHLNIWPFLASCCRPLQVNGSAAPPRTSPSRFGEPGFRHAEPEEKQRDSGNGRQGEKARIVAKVVDDHPGGG